MNNSTIKTLKKVFAFSRSYIPYMIAILLLNLLSTPLILLNPVPLKIVVDNVFGEEPLPELLMKFLPESFDLSFSSILLLAVSLVVIISILKNLQGLLLWIIQSYAGEKIVLSFRSRLFSHIQKMSLTYHDRVGISDSIYRIQYDAATIRDMVLNAFSPLLTALLSIFGMIYVIFRLQWQLSIIAIGIIPFLYILTKYSSTKLKKNWMQVKEYESASMSVIHEALSALRVVKAFVNEDHEQQRFERRSLKAVRGQIKVAFIGGGFDLVTGILIAIGTAMFLYYGSIYVKNGLLTVGELVLIMAYLGQLFGPMTAISKQINYLQSSFAGLERALFLLEEKEDVEESENPIRLLRSKGSVEFKNVEFYYKEDQKVIENISFNIRPGQNVGIVGATGSGKSTILSLLTRFYEPTYGQIFVDGENINRYKISDYRNQFGIVLQEPVLFSTTIAENISYGKPDASIDEIIIAAKAANAHDFISKFPETYDTQVGERGMQLSGGERQRISIARAFLKNAPILILDEPTSAVDVGTEASIMEAMDRLMEGKTTFMVTHRLDTLSKCDVLIHLEMGKVIDVVEGQKNELLIRKISSLRKVNNEG